MLRWIAMHKELRHTQSHHAEEHHRDDDFDEGEAALITEAGFCRQH